MRLTRSKAALSVTMVLGLLTSILGGVASAAYANASTNNLSTFSTQGSVTGQISSKGSFAASIPGSGPNGAMTTAQVTGQLGSASITGYKAATAAITTTATPSSTSPGTADFKFATSSSTMKLSVDGTLSPVGLAPASGLASAIGFGFNIDCVYTSGHWVWTITIGWTANNQ